MSAVVVELEFRERLLARNRGDKSRDRVVSELRFDLIALLAPAGCCAGCGERLGVERLEIDHLDGCTWSRRALGRSARVVRYWTEFLSGVRLRALCRRCNAIDGNRRRWKDRT